MLTLGLLTRAEVHAVRSGGLKIGNRGCNIGPLLAELREHLLTGLPEVLLVVLEDLHDGLSRSGLHFA